MVEVGDKFRIKFHKLGSFSPSVDSLTDYEVKEITPDGAAFFFSVPCSSDQVVYLVWDAIDWIKDEKPQITVGSKWQGKLNKAFIVEIVSVGEECFEYKGNISHYVDEYTGGIDNWLMYMEPYEETESEVAVKNEAEFINTKTTLKSGRFGNLHITNHNELVKVSVVQMTEAKQVRAVIEQLIKVAEFWEGEGK